MITFTRKAQNDIDSAYEWYEDQVAALGERFLTVVESALERIGESPYAFPLYENQIRRLVLSRFPYVIYYEVNAEQIIILRILHQSRNTQP